MCRLLGFISPTPTTAADLIGADECRQWQSMGNLHDDGWGTAWIDTGTEAVARFRTPTEGADDPRLTRVLDTEATDGRICHLRMATTGLADLEENTHPFLADGVAMAHNGSVHPIERLREYVSLDEIDEVGGTTDSAIVFALVLRRLRQGESLLDAVTGTVRMLRADFDHPGINLLLLTREEMIVVHATAGTEVPYLQGPLPPDHHDHYYRMSWRRSAENAMIVSSSGLEHHGWSLIEQNTIMRLTVVDGAETIVRL
ncbi:class II glutamine amidotransferase [Brevibacterium oceani]|uniref:class II glutamine amidotransferase n=1 Tax=Brevibacterium oceani TaxID=358099 RepID=UPI001B32DE17|nr:class II glutamine amidotransferase [Brevibacterium oceani]